MTDLELIRFDSVADEYGEFSNFAAYPIQLAGKRPSAIDD